MGATKRIRQQPSRIADAIIVTAVRCTGDRFSMERLRPGKPVVCPPRTTTPSKRRAPSAGHLRCRHGYMVRGPAPDGASHYGSISQLPLGVMSLPTWSGRTHRVGFRIITWCGGKWK